MIAWQSRDPENWVDVTDEQKERLLGLRYYRVFHNEKSNPVALAALAEAKTYVLAQRLKFNAANKNNKLIASLRHFGSNNPFDYADMFANIEEPTLATIDAEVRKSEAAWNQDQNFLYRAFVRLLARDQAIYYFLAELELPRPRARPAP